MSDKAISQLDTLSPVDDTDYVAVVDVSTSTTKKATKADFKGDKGDTGATGPTGPAGADGASGSDGAAATITVGTVTTGAAGSSVSITNSGTSSAAVFDFTIPKGDTGSAGTGSGDMLASTYDPTAKAADAFSQDNMADGTTNKNYTATEKTKLAAITGSNTGDQTITLTGDATGTGTGSFATTVGKINGVALSGLATGILKNTTTTGVPSIATAGTDYSTASATETLTNKTYDTAGTGNVFKINGTAISANTGTGSNVLATSPTLTTPTIGVATATSVNKVAITAPATSATLTIANGKTLTANNTLTLGGTDSTTMTFPSTSATIARTDAANTFTGHQTIEGVTSTGATGTGKFVFDTSPTIATPTITNPVLNATNPTAQTYTPSAAGTATLDLSLGNQHRITMPAGNITIALSNDTNSKVFLISITQDSVGSRTVTWFSTIKWAGGTTPTLTTTANKRDTFGFIRTGTTTYDGFVIGQNI